MEKLGAILIGVDNPSGIELLTSFRLNGIPVAALDSNPHALGFYSRYRGRCFLLKGRDERSVVNSLLALPRELRNWVLIPNNDHFVTVISRNHYPLSEYFRVATAKWDSVRFHVDKALTREAATRAGVPIPKTFHPKSRSDLHEIAGQLRFDGGEWLLKPRWRRINLDGERGRSSPNVFTWSKALPVRSKKSMIELSERACRDTGVFPLIQEKIPGGPEFLASAMTVVDEGRNPIAVFPSRKIRQHPREFGVGSYAEGIRDDNLVKLALKLFKTTGCYGFVTAEFKKDPRDGTFRLMESNPRAHSRLSLARTSGVDLPRILFDTFVGNQNKPTTGFHTGIRWVELRRELSLMVREGKPARVLELLRHLNRTKGFAYSFGDPVPLLMDLQRELLGG